MVVVEIVGGVAGPSAVMAEVVGGRGRVAETVDSDGLDLKGAAERDDHGNRDRSRSSVAVAETVDQGETVDRGRDCRSVLRLLIRSRPSIRACCYRNRRCWPC